MKNFLFKFMLLLILIENSAFTTNGPEIIDLNPEEAQDSTVGRPLKVNKNNSISSASKNQKTAEANVIAEVTKPASDKFIVENSNVQPIIGLKSNDQNNLLTDIELSSPEEEAQKLLLQKAQENKKKADELALLDETAPEKPQSNLIAQTKDFITNQGRNVSGYLNSAYSGIKTKVGSAVNSIQSKINDYAEGVKNYVNPTIDLGPDEARFIQRSGPQLVKILQDDNEINVPSKSDNNVNDNEDNVINISPNSNEFIVLDDLTQQQRDKQRQEESQDTEDNSSDFMDEMVK